MTTDPAKLAADAIAETWQLDNGKRDRIQELIEEQFTAGLADAEELATALEACLAYWKKCDLYSSEDIDEEDRPTEKEMSIEYDTAETLALDALAAHRARFPKA